MAEQISPINNAEMRLAQILGDDYLSQASEVAAGPAEAAKPLGQPTLSGNPFEDVLAKAMHAIDGVSRSEMHANQLIEKYMRGEVEMHEVMIAQSKISIMMQLAVSTITSAVTSFKEITQMQI
ncbi:MAG: flagellar hook-basal body complex protein FliE [Candidatus Margulisbacteria bacterium]|nr:flagellar hook-basal body complex protein FliE [Candidatus Margulisiibacteriota bacterium]